MTTRRSVSVAIHEAVRAGHPERPRVLLVQRPDDDADLPGVWGLPAASPGPGETWEAAVRRAGRDKLGIDLEGMVLLETGCLDRAAHVLEMQLFAASIASGEPRVPQLVTGVTQYQAWRWGDPAELGPAAARGSLCSRLYLTWIGG